MVRALETICIVALGLTACYEPPQPDCGFYCGPDRACPENYTCTSDYRCRRNGAADMCEPDAGVVGFDSSPGDAPVVDNTPPMLTFTSPSNFATNVAVNAPIIVSFSEPVFNVNSSSMSVFANSNVITGLVSAVGTPADYSTWQMVPDSALPASTTVTVTLTNQIFDTVGNELVTPPQTPGVLQFSFTTGP